jgi:hypothetical protein
MQVVSHTGTTYTLRNLVTGTTLCRSVHELKTFIPARKSPLDVARRDLQVYLVEKVIAHRGDTRRKEQMEFCVRWLGFGPSEETWEPWGHLKHNWVFHEYLRREGLKTLIPKEYREVIIDSRIGLQGVM